MEKQEYTADHLLDQVIDAIKAGKTNEAIEKVEMLWGATKQMHDGAIDMLSSLFTFIAEKCGEEAVGEAWRHIGKDVWVPFIEMLKAEIMPFDQVKEFLIAGHCAHYSEYTLEEDDEKIVFCVKDCGVGGRLAKEGKLDNTDRHSMNLGTIKKGYPWTLGQKGLPYYCCHGPLFFQIMGKEMGYDAFNFQWGRQFDEGGNPVDEPCKEIVYKKPRKSS